MGAEAADCYRSFNRREAVEKYNKPDKLVKKLIELFNVESKLSGEQAHIIMRDIIDPADGGLFFCWAKRGEVGLVPKSDKRRYSEWKGCSMCGKKPCKCNGKLLSAQEIDSYFSYLAQKRKKTKQSAGYTRGEADLQVNQAIPRGRDDKEAQQREEMYNPFLQELPSGDNVGF